MESIANLLQEIFLHFELITTTSSSSTISRNSTFLSQFGSISRSKYIGVIEFSPTLACSRDIVRVGGANIGQALVAAMVSGRVVNSLDFNIGLIIK